MAEYDIAPTHDHDDVIELQRTQDSVESAPATTVAVPGIAVGDAASARRLPADGLTDPLGGTVANASITGALRNQVGRGTPLPPSVADEFGERFGMDLSAVRVHHDAESGRLTDSLQATAFTYGEDVFFSPGSYDTGSSTGLRLIAHEVAHVVQQPNTPGSGNVMIGRADDPAEAEADRIADQALRSLGGETQQEAPQAARLATLQRAAVRRRGALTSTADKSDIDLAEEEHELADQDVESPTADESDVDQAEEEHEVAEEEPEPTPEQPGAAPKTRLTPAEEIAAVIRTARDAQSKHQDADKAADKAAEQTTALEQLQAVLKRTPRQDRLQLWADKALMDSALQVVGARNFVALAVAIHASESATNPFAAAVGTGLPPANEQEVQQRVQQLTEAARPLAKEARAELLADAELMELTMAFVGREQFGAVVTLLSTGPRTGQPLDVLIRHYLGQFNTAVRPAADRAASLGRRPTAEPTVLEPQVWARVADANTADMERALAQPPASGGPEQFGAHSGPMDAKAAGAAIRDGMRQYGDPAFRQTFGYDIADTVADYFARKVIRAPELQRKASLESSKRQEMYDWLNESFLQALGRTRRLQEGVLAEAYFAGDIDLLQERFVEFRTDVRGDSTSDAEAAFKQLFEDVADGYWADADDACRP